MHGHISPSEFRLYNKDKEINFALFSEKRISGNEKYMEGTMEGLKNIQNSPKPRYNFSGNDQSFRSPLIDYTSSGTCKDSVNDFFNNNNKLCV